ncbi:hypothetical protein EUTSA_v10013420mg [Eutrema salsugineum]|uniref:FBD domain-containing protein n=1 Tax=Eutrema salsugineum TaxID=72664 RepID=V4LDU6_EUTSA|nr:hypothetical protein EUTSA_v10013420mg [Eutrema salsugineum]
MMKLYHKYQKRHGLSSRSVREEDRIFKGEDRISILPEPLLCHILSFLTTEEAVWTSVLSSRWRYIWKWVPRLELDSSDFTNDKTCVDFIDKFLNFQSKSYLREFKLSIDQSELSCENDNASLYGPCLARVDMRKIQHFQVEKKLGERSSFDDIEIPLTLSVCEAMVCLKLHFVRLNDSESLSLPCLKIMYLEDVIFPSDAAAEALISCSPVLEDLKICLSKDDFVVSFTLKRADPVYSVKDGQSVVIDTPKLEYLSLMDYQFKIFKIINMSDSVKVDMDADFEIFLGYLQERNLFYDFFNNFSGVGDMTISWKTVKVIYIFQGMNPLPKFHYLTRLRATMCINASFKLLPIVLESYPNLKHFTLELVKDYPVTVITRLSTVLPHCLVSSLEYVEMESPVTEEASELNLARYFLENSATLKKLVLRLDQTSGKKHEPRVLKKLMKSPRRSRLCQFEVLPVVPTPNPWPEFYTYVNPTRF